MSRIRLAGGHARRVPLGGEIRRVETWFFVDQPGEDSIVDRPIRFGNVPIRQRSIRDWSMTRRITRRLCPPATRRTDILRNVFCQSLLRHAADAALVFLSGDLGFMALEPLRDAMGDRFINAGVAEQNLVSVAAALAREGMKPWCYSIAPFLYARALEQIRNDVCLHNLGVTIVGNGGGYGYGVMGATHHSTNDYGTIGCQPKITSFIPAFDADAAHLIDRLIARPEPAYLRLGLQELPNGLTIPPYAPWRKLLGGSSATIAACGPLVGGIVAAAMALDAAARPAIWVTTEMPLAELPHELIDDIKRNHILIAVEEHVAAGGMGQALAAKLLAMGAAPRRFVHRHAPNDTPTRYGSQKYHRRACGIDADSILALCSPQNRM